MITGISRHGHIERGTQCRGREGEKMIESVYNESRNGGHIARGYLIELMKNRLINCQFIGGIHLFLNISALFNCKLVLSQCL